MLFGLDGVEIGLIIVFLCLFAGILSGFPVAFAIGGAGVISFAIIAALDSAGLLIHQAIDTGSQAYNALVQQGVRPAAGRRRSTATSASSSTVSTNASSPGSRSRRCSRC